MCVYTLHEKGIRREYCGVRGANVEEVGATDIEETKLQTPVLRIYGASVVPCPQLRPTIVACSVARDCQVEEQQLEPMLRKYHNIGFLQWCGDEESARDLVVLDVQWMMEQMTRMLCQRQIKLKTRGTSSMS